MYHGKIERYYISRIKKIPDQLRKGIEKLDREGIIMFKIPYTTRFDYYPVQIALFALGNLEKFLDTGEERYREIFIRHVDWLVKNISIKDDFGVWEHNFVLPYYKFDRVPWVHGMAQGVAISALVRAYQLTGNKKYLEVAKLAYGAFERDIDEGGARYIDDKGNVWIEEYAILPPPHILNGFIFALFGIFDFYKITGSKEVLDLFYKGIKTVEKNLPLYDSGYWSFYDLIYKCPATKDYHMLHIEQLVALHKLTKNVIIGDFANKWKRYMNNPMNRVKALLERVKNYWKRYNVEILKVYSKRKRWLKK